MLGACPTGVNESRRPGKGGTAARSFERHPGDLALADLDHEGLAFGELERAVGYFLAVDLDPTLLEHAIRLGGARRETRLPEQLGKREPFARNRQAHLRNALRQRPFAEA